MDAGQIERVRSSFVAVSGRAPELADRFHTRLFARLPGLRALLPRDLGPTKREFAAMLGKVLRRLERVEELEEELTEVGARHARLGVTPAQYGMAREVFLETLGEMMGPGWTAQLAADWTMAANTVVSLLVVGAGRARAA